MAPVLVVATNRGITRIRGTNYRRWAAGGGGGRGGPFGGRSAPHSSGGRRWADAACFKRQLLPCPNAEPSPSPCT
jgi:hypothetical protein